MVATSFASECVHCGVGGGLPLRTREFDLGSGPEKGHFFYVNFLKIKLPLEHEFESD